MSGDIIKLSDDELAKLDDFLLSEACDDEALSVDEAHGFLTALLLSPCDVVEGEWLSQVWGEPRFADDSQRDHLQALLQRMYGEIEGALKAGRDFEPLAVEVEEDGVDVVAYEGWCFGFMMGVESCQTEWDKLPKDEANLLAPMAQLALLHSDEEPQMDEEEYEAWVELLPGAVMGLYGYWHRQ